MMGRKLVGIWDFHVLEGAGFLPDDDNKSELLLDVGPSGRALRGRLGELRVVGELAAAELPRLRWKLSDARGNSFDCQAIIDEVWGEWAAGRGEVTISGSVRRSGAQWGQSGERATFLARKRPFVEARERIRYEPDLLEWLVSPGHRMFHQLWHASRDKWHELSPARRADLRRLGWQPGPSNNERHARGPQRHRNGSGEDFMFMHRWMLTRVRSMQDFPSWKSLPLPQPYLEYDVDAFARYVGNADGLSVPPAWEASGDDELTAWLRGIKSSEGFFGNFQYWESQLQDPAYLSRVCLGELGSRIELGVHDWLHMRWASVCRNPNTGMALTADRNPLDYAERWFRPENDYLGDPFSSHMNPCFWYFHGFLDDRLEDWFLAHEQAHPGEVKRALVNGIPWFAPGPWVNVAAPWLGPDFAGCGAWGRSNGGGTGMLDTETMRLALSLVFGTEDEAKRLGKSVPRRPWYARQLT
jgi:hypothetical protein